MKRLQEKIQASTTRIGVTVGEELHNELTKIMMERSEEIQQQYPENSFQCLFWEQQLQATQAKCCTEVRWHPLIVWWCLHLKLLSSAAYHSLRSTGFIKLPSERTLREYTHSIQSGTGVQQEVTQQLQHEIAKIDMPEEVKQHTVVVCDEVKVKDGIVYDKHSFQVIGFTNLGDINSHLLAFE